MEGVAFTQSPVAVVTFIVAPAMLTNASCVLAMSTINRLLRTRDRMAQLYDKSESGVLSDHDSELLSTQVNRVERQATLLLNAMRAIYVALGCFAAATLLTLLAALIEHVHSTLAFRVLTSAGIALGAVGVGGLIAGSLSLFRATQLALETIREEAAIIRERQARRAQITRMGTVKT